MKEKKFLSLISLLLTITSGTFFTRDIHANKRAYEAWGFGSGWPYYGTGNLDDCCYPDD